MSMGTFKKHHRPCAKCSQPIAGNRTARGPRPWANALPRDCSVSPESPPTTLGGSSDAFSFPRQRGSRDRAERRSPLKWCEWCRVSRRLECPVRAGDGPNERTNCVSSLYLTGRDASLASLSECPSRSFGVVILILLSRSGAASRVSCFHDATCCELRIVPCRAKGKRSRPRYSASTLTSPFFAPPWKVSKQELRIEVRVIHKTT